MFPPLAWLLVLGSSAVGSAVGSILKFLHHQLLQRRYKVSQGALEFFLTSDWWYPLLLSTHRLSELRVIQGHI